MKALNLSPIAAMMLAAQDQPPGFTGDPLRRGTVRLRYPGKGDKSGRRKLYEKMGMPLDATVKEDQ